MKGRTLDRKIAALFLAVILLVYGVTSLGFAHEQKSGIFFVPHFDADTTTRTIEENKPAGTNVGAAVSAHSLDHGQGFNNLDRHVLRGTDAAAFTINATTGQLKSNQTFDYETKKTYSVTVVVQDGALVQIGQGIGARVERRYTDSDSIGVTINITDVDEADTTDEGGLTNPGPSFADALPGVSSEEAARIAASLTMNKVIFNEIFNASIDAHDWVELRNISDTDLSLEGWTLLIITGEGSQTFNFPAGTVLPAGELLLLVNTDPSLPDTPLQTTSEGVSSVYLVDAALTLPQQDVTLLLRSPVAWEDSAGNYFFGLENPTTAPPMTVDTAWFRIQPNTLGHRASAWTESGYQDGLGYDENAPEATSLGTPGYRSRLAEDLNGDGVINILDVVLVASQIGKTGELTADLNGDGTVNVQDLVLVANRFGSVAAAPSAALTAVQVEAWLRLAQSQGALPAEMSVSEPNLSYQRGIQVLEALLRQLRPKTTALLANYPNPFNPETWIPYQLATESEVQITIYDGRGGVVRRLDVGHQPIGSYQSRSRAAYWDGRNDLGESVASGLYFYTLTAGDFTATRKMLIRK